MFYQHARDLARSIRNAVAEGSYDNAEHQADRLVEHLSEGGLATTMLRAIAETAAYTVNDDAYSADYRRGLTIALADAAESLSPFID